jgi:hypothetical protein
MRKRWDHLDLEVPPEGGSACSAGGEGVGDVSQHWLTSLAVRFLSNTS